MSKRGRTSAKLVTDNVLDFVYKDCGGKESDLDNLYGDEDFHISLDVETRETGTSQHIDASVNDSITDDKLAVKKELTIC